MLLTLALWVWPVKMCTSTPKRAVVIKPCHATCNAEIQTCACGAQNCSAISHLRTVILFRLSSLSRFTTLKVLIIHYFLGCLLASLVIEDETFFQLSPKQVRDDFSVVGPIFTSVRFRERFHFLFWFLGGSERSQAPEIVKSSPSTLALGIKLKMNILIIPLADIFSCEGTNGLHQFQWRLIGEENTNWTNASLGTQTVNFSIVLKSLICFWPQL